MVTVQVNKGARPEYGFVIQAAGYGKHLVKRVHTQVDAERWRELAPSRLMLERLKGIVAQRRIAYEAKHFMDANHWKALNDLQYFIDQVSGAPAEKLYRMVVVHESKWRMILPRESNAITADMEEIIAYCKANAAR